MRSASTTASHRPLTWTTGLGEMRWESSPLSWNTQQVDSSCRVRTSPFPVTFLKINQLKEKMVLQLTCLKSSTSVKAAARQLDQEVKMSRFLNCYSVAPASCILFPELTDEGKGFVTEYFSFYPAFSWIKGKLVRLWVITPTASAEAYSATSRASVYHCSNDNHWLAFPDPT